MKIIIDHKGSHNTVKPFRKDFAKATLYNEDIKTPFENTLKGQKQPLPRIKGFGGKTPHRPEVAGKSPGTFRKNAKYFLEK